MTTTTPAPNQHRSRKWIKRRIDELDPEVDYVEIWRLTSLYNLNDFQFHWFYAITFPYFLVTVRGAESVYRDGAGKMDLQGTKRVDDTVDHMMVWWEHGPHSPATAKSVEMINKLHTHWARQYPGYFSYAEDYVNTLCYEATSMHLLQRSLGLPGYHEKQQVAAHRFWSEMAHLFTVEDGRPLPEVAAMPDSFDAMVEFRRQYDAQPWPDNPAGRAATASFVEHFATRWFPRPLHFFGRALVTSFFDENIQRLQAIAPPAPPLRWVARNLIKVLILMTEHVRPDDRETFPDRRRRLVAEKSARPSTVDVAVHRAIGRIDGGSAAQCPHAALAGVSRGAS
ncbi:hypothetical protein [Trujillonella humicola]|uniref:hypothetical protein n=1 Tax=Trujillonella humicola TaxID=3383699 RepID=UPI003905777B